jgi:hypothetical protein
MRAWLLRHRVRVLVHRIRFPGRPMFSSGAARDLIGRRVIVGLTCLDHRQHLMEQRQYHGRIMRMSLDEGIVILTPSGDEETLPPDLRALFGAPPGAYRFRSTGEVVVGADLQTSWTHTEPPP